MNEFKLFRPRPDGTGMFADAMSAARGALAHQIRVPHHTAHRVGMIGDIAVTGDSGKAKNIKIIAGECTLANGGVLVLQDLPEFKREVLEAVAVVYHRGSVRFMFCSPDNTFTIEVPARFSIYATAERCPCGLLPEFTTLGKPATERCKCSPEAKKVYSKRLTDFRALLEEKS